MKTRRPFVLAASAVLAAGVLGACGGSASRAGSAAATSPTAGSPATAAPPSAPASPPGGTAGARTVGTAHTSLGEVLVNGRGLTLYTLSSDAPGHLACTGGCLQVWPPVLLAPGASLTPPTGVTGLGRISRPEGTQVTWNGRPLYTYVGDSSPGSVSGQGIESFGGVWKAAVVSGGSGSSPGAGATTSPTSTSPTSTSSGGYGSGY